MQAGQSWTWILVLLSLPSAASGGPQGALRGTVVCDGKPVASAVMRVQWAMPSEMAGAKTLPGNKPRALCTVARTDEMGHFEFTGLDPSMRYNILVGSMGARTKLVAGLAPNAPDAPELAEARIELKATGTPDPVKSKIVRGRILGANGEPLAGAIVYTTSVDSANSSSSWTPGTDPIVVSGVDGRFEIVCDAKGRPDAPYLGVKTRIEADHYARHVTSRLTFGEDETEIRLSRGARLTGRVELGGKNASGIRVCLFPESGLMLTAWDELSVSPDAQGGFEFQNVAAGKKFLLYAVEGSGDRPRVSEIRTIESAAEATAADAGVVTFGPGLQVKGRVEVEDESPALPEGSWICIARNDAWVSWAAPLAADGSFSLDGLPQGGPYTFTYFDNDHMMSPRNASYRQGNYYGLEGMLTHDHTDMLILLCSREDSSRQLRLQDKPLRGIERALK